MARGHLDYKYQEFVRTTEEFCSGQGTLYLSKQLSQDLEIFALTVAKVILWLVVMAEPCNSLWNNDPQSSLSLSVSTVPSFPSNLLL